MESVIFIVIAIVIIFMVMIMIKNNRKTSMKPAQSVPLPRTLSGPEDTEHIAREKLIRSNYLIGGNPRCGQSGDSAVSGDIGSYIKDISQYGGIPPEEDRPYHNPEDCRKLRVVWLHTEDGKMYPWDIFPQSSYHGDRPAQDCELAKLLSGTRDRMAPLFTPDHVKLTN